MKIRHCCIVMKICTYSVYIQNTNDDDEVLKYLSEKLLSKQSNTAYILLSSRYIFQVRFSAVILQSRVRSITPRWSIYIFRRIALSRLIFHSENNPRRSSTREFLMGVHHHTILADTDRTRVEYTHHITVRVDTAVAVD